MTGTPKFEMLNGITWDTSRISEGLLFVKSIDTGIDPLGIEQRQLADERIFDLNGRVVSTDGTTRHLPAGIYVKGGKKIVVK
jgi:hypothetical protein